MDIIEIPKHVLANVEWIDSDDPKYKLRSREAYPYCIKNHPQDKTEPMAYIYKNANGHLYLHCHRCGSTVSIAQQLGKWNVPRISGNSIELSISKGDQLFIVGPNGSGKSALIQKLVSEHPHENIKRITAHRQTSLRSGDINYTPAQRKRYDEIYLDYNRNNASRYLDEYSSDEQSAILFDLDNKFNTINEDIANEVRKRDMRKAVGVDLKSPSPFDQINELLDRGRLNVELKRTKDRSIIAQHSQGQSFDITKMSDGERSAMIIAAHVITAETGTVFLIDEPEKHLNRSISQPFLSALFNLRKDCAFIISTHDIALPLANPKARVLMLESCRWEGDKCVAWDAQVLEPNSQLPDELKRAILGSRKRMLFVEGDSNKSLDFSLYKIIFPDIPVHPWGSCTEVEGAVKELRKLRVEHDIKAFGLIDRDDRLNDVEELSKIGVFALEVYSVESLYYCSDAIASVAHQQANSTGANANELIESVMQNTFEILKTNTKIAKEMAARRCERQVRQTALPQIPGWQSILDNPNQTISVPIDLQPYFDELSCFNKLVDDENWDQLITRYPLHKSPIFGEIAKKLKCPDKYDYQDRVRYLTKHDGELAKKLKVRIGQLSEVLDSLENTVKK